MRILLTNDDGIEAPGINALRKALSSLGELTVIAPDRERSASGLGITIHTPLRAYKMDYDDCTAYAVTGTPADCVKLALNELMDIPPDIVVSGINSGANLGTDVLYSGTVSAAIEGAIAGLPSIAVSLVFDEKRTMDYESAAQVACRLVNKVIKNGLPEETMLNINVPNTENIENIDFKITRLGIRKYEDSIKKRVDPRGREYYWIAGRINDIDCNRNKQICTDISAIAENKVSITPIHLELTNYKAIENLLTWEI